MPHSTKLYTLKNSWDGEFYNTKKMGKEKWLRFHFFHVYVDLWLCCPPLKKQLQQQQLWSPKQTMWDRDQALAENSWVLDTYYPKSSFMVTLRSTWFWTGHMPRAGLPLASLALSLNSRIDTEAQAYISINPPKLALCTFFFI